MRDPTANQLDALDRLIASGLPSDAPTAGRSETESLARLALAVRDAGADDAGLHVSRTWDRIAAALHAAPEPQRPPAWRERLAALAAGWRARSRGGLSLAAPMAALLVLTMVAVLAVLLVPGGRAEASFLEAVDELAAASTAALADDAIDAAEAAQLRTRIDAVLSALQDRPEELSSLPAAQTRVALLTLTNVRTSLDGVALDETGTSERAQTAALLSAAVAQLDTVTARVAALVDGVDGADGASGDRAGDDGSPDATRPPGDSDDSTGGADASDRDPARNDLADDAPISPTDRPVAIDGSDDVRGDSAADDAATGDTADRTDAQEVPQRPATDIAGETTPREPVRPSTTVDGTADGTDAVRPPRRKPPDATDATDATDEDPTPDAADATRDGADRATQDAQRPPTAEPVPDEEPNRDADSTTDPGGGTDDGSLDRSSAETTRADGSLNDTTTTTTTTDSEPPPAVRSAEPATSIDPAASTAQAAPTGEASELDGRTARTLGSAP